MSASPLILVSENFSYVSEYLSYVAENFSYIAENFCSVAENFRNVSEYICNVTKSLRHEAGRLFFTALSGFLFTLCVFCGDDESCPQVTRARSNKSCTVLVNQAMSDEVPLVASKHHLTYNYETSYQNTTNGHDKSCPYECGARAHFSSIIFFTALYPSVVMR